ncbi:MAG: Tim44 domain-containing protein [Chromatiales bacterium]|nr:Tim44 domain-containing protein [Chromatiales bacterium]
MKNPFAYALALFVGLTLGYAAIPDAEAKRLGGGTSFGSKSTYSKPAQRSTSSNPASTTPAQQTNQQQRTALSQRGGLMGMLGGLALGGLLGALFFGGAFENINFFDILIFGVIAFLLYKVFASKARQAGGRPSPAAVGGFGGSATASQAQPESHEQHGNQRSSVGRNFDTDLLFRKGNGAGSADGATQAPAAAEIPADFDRAAFLGGAERAYRQLQEAWDQGDLAELRGLTTDQVFAELQDQLRNRDGDNRTDLLKVGAELLEVRQAGDNQEAAVLFDVLMRENDPGSDGRPYQVREVWHFVRSAGSSQPTWFLDGIQQLDD